MIPLCTRLQSAATSIQIWDASCSIYNSNVYTECIDHFEQLVSSRFRCAAAAFLPPPPPHVCPKRHTLHELRWHGEARHTCPQSMHIAIPRCRGDSHVAGTSTAPYYSCIPDILPPGGSACSLVNYQLQHAESKWYVLTAVNCQWEEKHCSHAVSNTRAKTNSTKFIHAEPLHHLSVNKLYFVRPSPLCFLCGL